MSKDKEILVHLAQGKSQRHIAAALHVSRNMVAKVAAAAKNLSLSPADWKELAESELLSRCRSYQTSAISIESCFAAVSR
ncbi:helix-turn-helix domain-containing protein [Mitsuokella sp. AF33-22]|uniref:helix-turn-helix domain-containing protein n=1 Tax=Mitsuokella sp. AF33-22 TaxID=2292047 RepID=UPI0011C49723|nr:helix-turn-helix domain-containing protein [Mitsuokella sp. AF33-22]